MGSGRAWTSWTWAGTSKGPSNARRTLHWRELVSLKDDLGERSFPGTNIKRDYTYRMKMAMISGQDI